MRYELYLALRYLRVHRGRTFLSVITLISISGVAVGTAALVIALSLMAGFLNDVRERIHSGSAHLTVMSAEYATFGGVSELIGQVESVPGVKAAGPVLHTQAMLTLDEAGSPGFAEVHGIDPSAHTRVIVDLDEQDNPFLLLDGPTSSGRDPILLGEQLALKMGVFTGSQVRVLVPRITLAPWGPQPRSRLFEVVGTYRSKHFQEDLQRAYVSIDAGRRLLRAPEQASWLEVRLEDMDELAQMKFALSASLKPGWLVVDLLEQNQDLLKALNTEKLMLFLAIGLIVVVAALNIVSTLILLVTDKIKEIGTLSAMGARPGGIAIVFILQGMIIGLIGTGVGLILGASIAFVLDHFELLKLNPDIYFLTHLPFTLQPLDLVVVGAAAMLISFLATIYPAVKAARLDPVEAIRYE